MRLLRPSVVWIVTGAALFGPQLAISAADQSLSAVFERMDRAASGFRDLTADVRKVSHMEVLKEETVDTGKIALKMPKPHDYRMLVVFTEPDPRKIMIVGTKVEIYNPKENVVQDLDLGKARRSQVESFLLLGFGSNSKDLQSAYTVTLGSSDTVAGQKATRIELVPKSKDVAVQFPKFELWISDATGISVQQKMYQRGGDYSLATYTNMKLNQSLPDSAVKLNLPKGVQHERVQ